MGSIIQAHAHDIEVSCAEYGKFEGDPQSRGEVQEWLAIKFKTRRMVFVFFFFLNHGMKVTSFLVMGVNNAILEQEGQGKAWEENKKIVTRCIVPA